jgi:quercetin 2,3-dioxygenase
MNKKNLFVLIVVVFLLISIVMAAQKTKLLKLKSAFAGLATSDGAGVKLTRYVGTRSLAQVDPFLMLDSFDSENGDDYIAGFPTHPHRGQITFTYLRAGKLEHRDSNGNQGLLVDGGGQWMVAGSGVMHSEMPMMTGGLLAGFQFWINLPREHKMAAPSYHDVKPDAWGEATLEGGGGKVIVLVGNCGDVKGPIDARYHDQLTMLDVHFDGDSATQPSFEFDVPSGHNSLVHVYKGAARLASDGDDDTPLESDHVYVFEKAGDAGGRLHFAQKDGEPFGAIVASGKPLDEPIARHGPFVMSTQAEIRQCFVDLQRDEFIKVNAKFQ